MKHGLTLEGKIVNHYMPNSKYGWLFVSLQENGTGKEYLTVIGHLRKDSHPNYELTDALIPMIFAEAQRTSAPVKVKMRSDPEWDCSKAGVYSFDEGQINLYNGEYHLVDDLDNQEISVKFTPKKQ